MTDDTSSNYPTLSPEAAKRLYQKIEKLQNALDNAVRRNHWLEQQNTNLEAALKTANRTKEGYLQIASGNLTFETPTSQTDWCKEPFSN